MKNKGVFMKRILLTLIIMTMTSQAKAKDLSAEDGLIKIEKNITTSQSNIESFLDNLTTINGNITLLGNSQAQMETQKRSLQNTHKENEKILSNHTKEVAKIDGMITKEKNLLEDERLKIQKMEALLIQLKAQQDQRSQNILELQAAKDRFVKSKEKGLENQKTLAQSIQEVDKGIQLTKKEIQTWNSKKKSNDKEIAKWTNEKDKHLKMQDEIKVLLNN
jgi:chromosome segregation ATPase